jgi:lambda repressor-like predicted transcriptional regulator
MVGRRRTDISRKKVEQRIFAMRRKGCTIAEISRSVGYSTATVRLILLRNGFPGRVPLYRYTFSPEVGRAILGLHKCGYSLREIGKAVGYSYETVRTFLRRNRRTTR